MNTKLLQTFETQFLKKHPQFEVGDTIAVNLIVREGDKKRIQVFKGLVISKQNSGARATFTIRKVSYGIGVEKILPVHSPNIEKIEIIKKGNVRRSKLYYMRDRVGKKALKVREGVLDSSVNDVYDLEVPVEGEAEPEMVTAETEVKAEDETEMKQETEANAEVKAEETATVEEKANEESSSKEAATA